MSDSANSMRRSEKSIFPDMVTSDLAQREWYKSKDRVKSIKAEAIALSEDKEYSSMAAIMALSTVMRRPIFSLYPDIPYNKRKLFHRRIEPQLKQFDESFYVLWSRDGGFNITRGRFFEPNHFVPIIQEDIDD